MNIIPSKLHRPTDSFSKRRKARRDWRRQRLSAAVERLEPRALLAGLVMSESLFDADLFAENLEEQIPVDPTGPNGVVGYSYSIIDGDPENPISGQGGFAVMPWDGPGASPTNPIGVALAANADRPQETASPSKVLTAAAVMHLTQEQILLEDPGLNPGDLAFDLQTAISQEIVNYLPAPWAAGGWPTAGVNFANITIAELLTHSSGLRSNTTSTPSWVTTSTLPTGGFTGGANAYNYAGLQQISQFGSVDPATPTDYWTNNFAWFRVMLPYMWNQINNGALDVNATNGAVVDTAALIPDVVLRADSP